MIDPVFLKQRDIGAWVVYHNGFGEEKGRIKSWDQNYIYVVYNCDENWEKFKDYTAMPTLPRQLEFSGFRMD